jgi:hypothetical protein
LVGEPDLEGEGAFEDGFEAIGFAGFSEELVDASDAAEQGGRVTEVSHEDAMDAGMIGEGEVGELKAGDIVEVEVCDEGVAGLLCDKMDGVVAVVEAGDVPMRRAGGEGIGEFAKFARGAVDEEDALSHRWEGLKGEASDGEDVAARGEGEIGMGTGLEHFEGLCDGGADGMVGILERFFECLSGVAFAEATEGFGGGEADIAIVIGESQDERIDGGLAAIEERFGHEGGIGFAGLDFADTGESGGGGLADPVFLIFEGIFEVRDGVVGEFGSRPVGFDEVEGAAGGLADDVFGIDEGEDEVRDSAGIVDGFEGVSGGFADFAVAVFEAREEGFAGSGIAETTEGEDGGFADFPFIVLECFDEGVDGLGIAELTECFRGEGADVFVRVFECEDERGDGAVIADAAKGIDGGGADGFIRIFERIEEDADDTIVGDLAEGFDGGLALIIGAVIEDEHDGFDGVGAEDGGFFDVAECDGAKSALGVGGGFPF